VLARYHTALVEAGFTRAEALELVKGFQAAVAARPRGAAPA